LARRFQDDGEQVPTDLMMLQLWVESSRRLEPEDLQLFTRSFEEARARLIETVGVQASAKRGNGKAPEAVIPTAGIAAEAQGDE
jgi:hypothetical protein